MPVQVCFAKQHPLVHICSLPDGIAHSYMFGIAVKLASRKKLPTVDIYFMTDECVMLQRVSILIVPAAPR